MRPIGASALASAWCAPGQIESASVYSFDSVFVVRLLRYL